MQYRPFGDSGIEVSALGLGLMRLPTTGDDSSDLDMQECIRMVHRAIEEGVTYFDTAYRYHGGSSEPLVAEALTGGYREKVHLATKLPTWLVESEGDLERYFTEQLQRMGTDYVDSYLLHGLDADRWDNMKRVGALQFLDEIRSDGRARTVGFSFHDELDVFRRIVDSHDWDMCLIQLNYMDHAYQAGVAGMRYAADRGMGVAVMEPLRGGNLAGRVPDDIRAIWDRAEVQRTPAEWGLRWVWNHPEVSVVLSGMSTMEQLLENVRTAEDALPDSLTEDEKALIDEVRDIYLQRTRVDCTGCEYCMPCPEGVEIPRIFNIYNDASMFGEVARSGAASSYANVVSNDGGVDRCVDCGECLEACPQDIDIPAALREARDYLTAGNGK